MLTLAFANACPLPHATPCRGEGAKCPAGTVCDPLYDYCVSPEAYSGGGAGDAAARDRAAAQDSAAAEGAGSDLLHLDRIGGERGPADGPVADLATRDVGQPDGSSVDAAAADGGGAERVAVDAASADASRHDAAPARDGDPADLLAPDLAPLDRPQGDVATADAVPGDLPRFDAAPPDAAQADLTAPDTPAGDAATPCQGAPPSAALCDADDTGLIACFSFDADLAVGTVDGVLDGSQHGNHGTALDATYVAGVEGLAIALSGQSGSRVQVEDSASLDVSEAVTIEAFVHPKSFPTSGRVTLVDNDGQYSIFFTPLGEISCKGVVAGSLPLDTWSHVACTIDAIGERVRIYQDGLLVADEAYTSGLPTDNTNPMNIGANSPSGDNFDGQIDAFRLWSVARSADQICWAAQR